MRRWGVRRSAIVIGAILALPATVFAAEVQPSDVAGCDFHLRGPITEGDHLKLDGVGGSYQGRVLCLDSPGGSLLEGKKLFDRIWEANIRTRIVSGERCESACSLAFLGGSVTQGTAVIHLRDRKLDAGGTLGFHAPSLDLPAGGSFSGKQIEQAFEIALKAAENFFEIKVTKRHGVSPMNDFLYHRILTTRPSDMYRLTYIGDAVLSDIALQGLTYPEHITAAEIQNICDNTFASTRSEALLRKGPLKEQFREALAGDGESEMDRRAVITRTGDEIEGKAYGYYSPSKFGNLGCHVRLTDGWSTYIDEYEDSYGISVSFYGYSVGQDFNPEPNNGRGSGTTVPPWFVYHPLTPISSASTAGGSVGESPRDADVKVTAVSDRRPASKYRRFVGADLPDGDLFTARKLSPDQCIDLCAEKEGCSAVTYDRWNRYCFAKNVSRSAGKLYVQAKSDTYVLQSETRHISVSDSKIELKRRRGKAFVGEPNYRASGVSYEQCRHKCGLDRSCLAFNHVPSRRSCEFFHEPPEYFSKNGYQIGVKQQVR
ncbi:PAN domain-containing protein [Roseibium sp. AS2]|uniref:PAN domain-containing protein n=1 Tax=Roseibium sp. AS2 TaxID=3135781 RepID=UPI00316EA98B